MIASPNFDDRLSSTSIDMLVIHYTGMRSAKAALDRLCDPQAKVSAHYFIDEDGDVISLVDESKRAWHAGIASWRGMSDINTRSIGVELVNPGHDLGYRDFPKPQMAALIDLLIGILSRYSIPARNVVGHSDIAPCRKIDPGERFDWAGLAEKGIGLWPNEANINDNFSNIAPMLSEYGYDISSPPHAIAAFQRHFHPETINKNIDYETIGRLKKLLDLSYA
jgi:N-acetylmuramoyl-L-alanine amidase